MKISRSEWLASAAENRTPRHMRSLCLLITTGDGYAAKERYLAERLLRRMDGFVQLPIAEHAELRDIRSRFADLEAQVAKRSTGEDNATRTPMRARSLTTGSDYNIASS